MNGPVLIGIAAVAEQTGLSAHLLRAWERRYGFPKPQRAANGERLYTADQVRKLGLLRRLSERGHRPRLIAGMPEAELERLLADRGHDRPAVAGAVDMDMYFRSLLSVSVGELRRRLHAALVRQGLGSFVIDTLAPLQQQIGAWWETGRISPDQEQQFSDQVERLLREAMAPLDDDRAAKVMLTTFPSERHSIGLLMVEALLRLEGASCIPIGVETSPAQMVKLAAESGADIVALSFSAAYADPNGRRLLSTLRQELPPQIALWVGGEGAAKVARALRGVSLFDDLDDMVEAFRWQYPAA